jgi:superfamily II DNA helicase RecQ
MSEDPVLHFGGVPLLAPPKETPRTYLLVGLLVLVQETMSKDIAAGRGRTLVFGASVAAAQEIAEVLAEVGIRVVQYHREVSAEERAGPTHEHWVNPFAFFVAGL